jgi:hypothetical protein
MGEVLCIGVFLPNFLAALLDIPLVHWLSYSFLLVHGSSSDMVSNFVKAYLRIAEKRKHFCAALEHVLPDNRIDKNLLESGRGHSGKILENVIQWFQSSFQ